jgi:hypothetical protein
MTARAAIRRIALEDSGRTHARRCMTAAGWSPMRTPWDRASPLGIHEYLTVGYGIGDDDAIRLVLAHLSGIVLASRTGKTNLSAANSIARSVGLSSP